jgi:hypothetical protein
MFGKLEEYLGIFGEMALTIDDGISSRTISTQCFPGENCQELPVPSSLGGIDIEESFCLESFDGCASALEFLPKDDGDISAYLSEHLSRRDAILSAIVARLTTALRDNHDALMIAMDHMRSIEDVVTHGCVLASNLRRTLMDSKREMVTGILQALRTRRRHMRLEEVHNVARGIFDALRLNDHASEAVMGRNLTAALSILDSAHSLLSRLTSSKLLVLAAARRRSQTTLHLLRSIVDEELANFVHEHNVFDETRYSEIISAYAMLDNTYHRQSIPNVFPCPPTLSKQIAVHAITRLEAAANETLQGSSIASTALQLASAVIAVTKLVYDAIAWHTTSPTRGINDKLPLEIAYPSNAQLVTRMDSDSVSTSFGEVIADIWCRSKHVIIEVIAANIPAEDCHSIGDFRRRPRLVDVALALEALETARHFALHGNTINPDIEIQERVCLPYFKSLRADTIDGLHQMLACEPWVCADISHNNDPQSVFSRTAIRADLQVAIASTSALKHTSLLLDEDSVSHGEPHIAILGNEDPGSMCRPTLVATQAAFHGVQRPAVQYVQVVALFGGLIPLVIETLFEVFETYLVGVAAAHLSSYQDVVPSCEQVSAQLRRLIRSAPCHPSTQAEVLADVEGAIVAAESLLFVRDALVYAAKAIFTCDVEVSEQDIIKRRLMTAVSLAMELRFVIHRAIGSRLVDATAISWDINSLDESVWLSSSIQEECNYYIHTIIARLQTLWASLTKANGRFFHNDLKELVWVHAVQSTFEALVDGFSGVHRCSTEGRALMSMDLQVFQASFDKIHCAQPLRGSAYVDSYIKAWYFDNQDLQAWIVQNEENYHKGHLDALVRAHKTKTSANSKWR